MSFRLEDLAAAVADRAVMWARLGLAMRTGPIGPNHGKPVVHTEFESATWAGMISVWSTGEAELETVRWTDDRIVNKHYDLTGRADIEVLLDEFVALVGDDRLPNRALVHRPRPDGDRRRQG